MPKQTISSVSHERLLELLAYDPETGNFTRRRQKGAARLGRECGSLGSSGYLRVMIDGRSYLCHRLAWFYVTGEWPKAEIDHRNLVKTDNRFANLRQANRNENAAHRNLAKRRLPRGVRVCGRRFQAHITHLNEWLCLGCHDTPEQASAAYEEAANRLRGEFGPKALKLCLQRFEV